MAPNPDVDTVELDRLRGRTGRQHTLESFPTGDDRGAEPTSHRVDRTVEAELTERNRSSVPSEVIAVGPEYG